jgi:hypothetical protein
MMGVEHRELSNSSLGHLNDVGLTKKVIEFFTENTPTALNGRLGVGSKKWLPPDQGNADEVGCCIGDTLPFVLEFSRLVVSKQLAMNIWRRRGSLPVNLSGFPALESPSGTV